jgi:acetylornithine/N-succinyldiaminopimelate aminotransferase
MACAVGGAVMDIVATDAFLGDVNGKAGLFRQKLEGLVASHPEVFEEVRGVGLMIGVKCKVTNLDVVKAGYDVGVLTVPGGDNVIRLLPPLNMTDEEIGQAVDLLDQAATAIEAKQ